MHWFWFLTSFSVVIAYEIFASTVRQFTPIFYKDIPIKKNGSLILISYEEVDNSQGYCLGEKYDDGAVKNWA